MNIDQLKSDIITKGYTHFNLKDFNEDYYNQLLEFKCNETHNLKHLMTSVRVDGTSLEIDEIQIQENSKYSSFEEASNVRLETLKLIKGTPFQSWFYTEYNILPINEVIKKIKYNIARTLFSIDNSIRLKAVVTDFTFFDYGCHISNHRDGTNNDRICSIILYLNETYDKKDGGILKLKNEEEILPLFGNVAIISLEKTNANIEHEVSKVVGGIGRYAITTFVKYGEPTKII
jgi:Rps23 Pro-64 3,4-dihydroxylase Tpa1-like proline 4-hydroxylase